MESAACLKGHVLAWDGGKHWTATAHRRTAAKPAVTAATHLPSEITTYLIADGTGAWRICAARKLTLAMKIKMQAKAGFSVACLAQHKAPCGFHPTGFFRCPGAARYRERQQLLRNAYYAMWRPCRAVRLRLGGWIGPTAPC